MSQTLFITIVSAIVCMAASQVFYSPPHHNSAPKPPVPPLTDSCFNKTFGNLFLCQYQADKKWQNDTDQRQAFCCSTWEAMNCSFPYIEKTCNETERASVDLYFMEYEGFVIDYVQCKENLPYSDQCAHPQQLDWN